MYGIFTYIWWNFMLNVGKYTIHGWYGLFTRIYISNGVTTPPTFCGVSTASGKAGKAGRVSGAASQRTHRIHGTIVSTYIYPIEINKM